MNIDITKYLKNKDVNITNDDIDLEAMEKDVYKGYTPNSEIKKPDYSGYVKKDEFDKLQKDYTALETNYNTTVKTLSDTNDKMTRVSLENKLVKKGFNEEDFDSIVKIRNSVYADETDDQKAVDLIADKFGATYLKQEKKFDQAPNEAGVKGNENKGNEIKITRNTSIKDLIIPVAK